MQPRALPPLLHVANDGCAFLLELAALAILAWWGATRSASLVSSVLLGGGAPLAAAVVWGLFAAPKARIRLPMAGVLAVKALVFVSAAAALWALGRPGLSVCFATVALTNAAIAAFDRDARMRAARKN
jgi:Protein of unknown function (DUF2568)